MTANSLFDGTGAPKCPATLPYSEIIEAYPLCSVLVAEENLHLMTVDLTVELIVVVADAEPLPDTWRAECAHELDKGGAIAIHAASQGNLRGAITSILELTCAGRA